MKGFPLLGSQHGGHFKFMRSSWDKLQVFTIITYQVELGWLILTAQYTKPEARIGSTICLIGYEQGRTLIYGLSLHVTLVSLFVSQKKVGIAEGLMPVYLLRTPAFPLISALGLVLCSAESFPRKSISPYKQAWEYMEKSPCRAW